MSARGKKQRLQTVNAQNETETTKKLESQPCHQMVDGVYKIAFTAHSLIIYPRYMFLHTHTVAPQSR